MIAELRELARTFPDPRTGRNTQFTMEDVVLAAFAVFWTQSPSFLAQQTRMRQVHGRSNAETLFGMTRIPSDNHIRELLDPVPPAALFPWFEQIVARLQARDRLVPYRVLDGQLLIALDGTQYHSSDAIHCAQCTRREHADGHVSYAHTVVTPVIVAPGCPRVLPLSPEFVTPQDGHAKQDCEHAAAKRWMLRAGPAWRHTPVTLLGDDLYARQPLCEAARAAGFHFLFVCKPSSHPTLYEWLTGLRRNGQVDGVQQTRHHGRQCEIDTYAFAQQLPLRDGKTALEVNWCELTTTDAAGKVRYHNAFITDHPVSAATVVALVAAGRARWKVENENNNTLKTQGYHLTHNFGHGQQHLAATLVTLNLVAFLIHTVLALENARYAAIRSALGARKRFFRDIQALTCYLYFGSFEALLAFMGQRLELPRPDSS
ncbi:MAG TPA: ISNCY family transposase [Rhodanobacteraceae bacterium]